MEMFRAGVRVAEELTEMDVEIDLPVSAGPRCRLLPQSLAHEPDDDGSECICVRDLSFRARLSRKLTRRVLLVACLGSS